MKYELSENTKVVNGITLYQIRALKDFGDVKAGDLGGWIQSAKNLSQKGNCWIFGNAWVSGNARIFGNARVFGNAQVFGNSWMSGNARIFGNAQICGNCWIFGNSWVYDNAQIFGNAWVFGNAQVSGNSWVYDNAMISGNAQVSGNAKVSKGKLNCKILYISNAKHTISVISKEIIQIGCKNDTLNFWLSNEGLELAKYYCYTDEEIEITKFHLNYIKEYLEKFPNYNKQKVA